MKAYELKPGAQNDPLVQVDRPSPPLGPTDVRVRVRAVSLNFRDLTVARGAKNRTAPIIPTSDGAGEVVLRTLKQDPALRHIPVHVISVADYTQIALSMGAIGYVLKPAKREELERVFRKLEQRLTHRVQRLLIVEADPEQRKSLRQLLEGIEVELSSVGTAAEALSRATGAPVASANAVTRLIKVIQKAGDWSPQYDAIQAIKYFSDPRVVPTLIEGIPGGAGWDRAWLAVNAIACALLATTVRLPLRTSAAYIVELIFKSRRVVISDIPFKEPLEKCCQ